MKNEQFDSNKEGIRIVKVAAFCFAIISWIATAQGLSEYVFKDNIVLSLLASFGIQSVLFVLNLKLPEYYSQIKVKTNSFRNFWRVVISFFYCVFLFVSSFFSFVYICNFVYSDTIYIDSTTYLDKVYRSYLSVTEYYLTEYLSSSAITISNELSTLQKMVPEASDATTLEELKQQLVLAKQEVSNCEADEKMAKEQYNIALAIYMEPMTQRWRDSKTHDDEKTQCDDRLEELNAAQKRVSDARAARDEANNAVKQFKPSADASIHALLAEFLSDSLNETTIQNYLTQLLETVLNLGESGNGNGYNNYAEIVAQSQALNLTINKFLQARSLLNGTIKSRGETTSSTNANNLVSISKIKDDLRNNVIEIPDPTSSNSEILDKQKDMWASTWRNRIDVLDLIIKSAPRYSSSNNNGSEAIINVQLLSDYSPDEMSNHLQDLMRWDLTRINAVERACGLLFRDYPLLAWFSALFALFFDLASLLAGLFAYLVSKKNIRPNPDVTNTPAISDTRPFDTLIEAVEV